jgi:hypothetical protein
MQNIHWLLKWHTTVHTPRLILTQTCMRIYPLILKSGSFERDLTLTKCNSLLIWLQKSSLDNVRFQKKFLFFFCLH